MNQLETPSDALISVIVPIYNVSDYLERCLDSILNQTYTNLEIILIDDGSTDDSSSICDDYAERDGRIICIHKKNGGLSDARNTGLKIATGTFIAFVDSDDFITDDMLETLLNICLENNAQMSACDYRHYYQGDSVETDTMNGKKLLIFSPEEALQSMYEKDGIGWAAWNKLYAKDLFHNIEYPVGRIMEDKGTTYKLIDKCTRIAYLPVKKYYYFIRSGSIMRSRFSDRSFDTFIFSRELELFFREKYPRLVVYQQSNTFYTAMFMAMEMILLGIARPQISNVINIAKTNFKGSMKLENEPFAKKTAARIFYVMSLGKGLLLYTPIGKLFCKKILYYINRKNLAKLCRMARFFIYKSNLNSATLFAHLLYHLCNITNILFC